ncbi:hypothetical protein D3C73_961130 [compost metagenome]
MAEQPVAAQIIQHLFTCGDDYRYQLCLLVLAGKQAVQQKPACREFGRAAEDSASPFYADNPVDPEAADVPAPVAVAGHIPPSLPEHQPVRIDIADRASLAAAFTVLHLQRQSFGGAGLQLRQQLRQRRSRSMQHLDTALVALHLRQLLLIAVVLELGNCAVQRLCIWVSAALGKSGNLDKRPAFPAVKEERGGAEMLRKPEAAAGTGIGNDRDTARTQGIDIAVH